MLSLLRVFSDWAISNADETSLLSVLDEAYYAISCDYFLAAYLQYPSFRHQPEQDFLEPYAKLWQFGHQFVLTEQILYVVSR